MVRRLNFPSKTQLKKLQKRSDMKYERKTSKYCCPEVLIDQNGKPYIPIASWLKGGFRKILRAYSQEIVDALSTLREPMSFIDFYKMGRDSKLFPKNRAIELYLSKKSIIR